MLTITNFLKNAQNPDGGWGYAIGQASTVEPTSAALLALYPQRAQRQEVNDVFQRGIEWLQKGQHADGAWGYTHADREGTWLTAWALLAWARCGQAGNVTAPAIDWLLTEPVMSYRDDELQAEFRRTSGIDISVQGWPWLPGEASWVEPTAMAMLALLETPTTDEITLRLKDAERCLQDRRCVGGGWNVGSPVMLGAALPARIIPTAWAVLALQKYGFAANRNALVQPAQQGILPEDVEVLRHEMTHDGNVPALAWGLLALHALGETELAARDRLAYMQDGDGGWDGNPYHTAIAALALDGGWA